MGLVHFLLAQPLKMALRLSDLNFSCSLFEQTDDKAEDRIPNEGKLLLELIQQSIGVCPRG